MGRGAQGAVGIVGLGLLGGSLARALRAVAPARPLVGVETSAATRALAARDGLFDELLEAPGAPLAACAIAVLCAPAAAIQELLGPVSRHLPDGAILTDVCGVKEPIVAAARGSVRPGVAFVGAHPMFGGEQGGYAASRAEAWRGGKVAVCTDGADPAAVELVADLHRGLGAEVILCSAADHDAAVAAVSHVPYLVASAMAASAADAGPLARALAGKGLGGMIRLAGFRHEVQGEVTRQNPHVPAAAARFEARLRELLDALADPDPDAAAAALDRARAAKESLG